MWRSTSAMLSRRISKQHGQLIRHTKQWTGDTRPVLAIRREDVNVWERRAPLAPHHVRQLIKRGVKVIVQPSNRRAYPMQAYINRGAIIQEDISEATFIVGVKQVPIDLLLPNRTYAFFSHTIKAQESNMPLLDAILQKNIRLIDYEKMVDDQGQRVVAFGKYAGVAGMINVLHGLGLRLLALGHHTPFMHIGPSHNYRNSEMARRAIRDAGYEICLGMMPKSVGPLTFVFTGSGNVSQGAQEVFQELPYEYVEPEHLPKVAQQGATNKIYACVVSREDHYVRDDGSKFNAAEFEQHPERYVSTFSKQIAPYASCIVNGIYYAPNSPRLMSIPDAKELLSPQETPWIPSSVGCPKLPHRLLAICDISADPGGSIEFMKECTTIDSPFCLYDADRNMNTESFAGSGVLICSIDNMPAQIPREATDFFGGLLLPYVFDMIKSDATAPFEEYDASPVVKNSVIASNGNLTPNFEYINEMRNKKSRSLHKARMTEKDLKKRVLMLGAGYVSAPAVEYLSRDDNLEITVASQFQDELDVIAARFPEAHLSLMDITRSDQELEEMVQEHDIVVSLLPYGLHPAVAKMCIKHETNMVTASYLSPAMKELHNSAKEAGITIMNEVGVDPGIDHMFAMECFSHIHQHGGKVTSFLSWCGGLPAPEFSDTPLRYKFSWFPKGVLMNVLTGARYLDKGEIVEIEEGGSLLDNVQDLDFLPGFNLEGFANRDSTKYTELYGIPNCKTLLRGTIRYKGFSEAMAALLSLGLLDNTPKASLHPNAAEITWKNLMCELLGTKSDILVDSVKDNVLDRCDNSLHKLQCIEDLGLLSDELVDKKGSPVDTLCNYLSKRLAFSPGERDIILLRHEVGVEWVDGSRETRNISFVVYGDTDGFSAMAKTVGLPTGIATKMVLEGEIQRKGMVLPLTTDIYRPMIQRLAREGLTATEVISPLQTLYGEQKIAFSLI